MDGSEAQRRLESYSLKDRPLIKHIDETLADYDAYVALDHQLATEGTATYLRALRQNQNGNPAD